jgi:hypothetical protein
MADALTHFGIGQVLGKLIDIAVLETAVIIAFLKNREAVENRRSRNAQAKKICD